jgi:PAS domain S-box-containing protein
LEKSHHRYQDLYQNAPVGYITLDKDGIIVDSNQTAAVMFGAQKAAMINQSFETLIDPSERQKYYGCRESLQNEDLHVCEMTLRKTDASTFNARIEAKDVTDTEGNQRQTRVIITDISAQKEIQRQAIESRKLDAISTLAGGVAHQFNNALAGLTGYLELIQIELHQNDVKSTYIGSALQQIQRMANLTHQLLAYASGGKYAPEDIQLDEFIDHILALIHHTISKSNRLETDLQANTHMIRADNTQIQMVLLALVQNASEAMTSPGRITISTRNVTFLPEDIDRNSKRRAGKFVCLCVTDEGCGMDTATMEKIFDPFFTTKFIGRGLGLSAVFGIISNHRGWIEVDSTLDKGTKVSIYLPAVTPQVKKPIIRKEVDTDGHDATVLVIEDDMPLRKVTRQLLCRLNYRILEAETGEKAREIVNDHSGPIDVVILDMLLPDTDGESLYYKLREMRPGLKIILCSGYAMDKPVKDLLKAGALGFLPKPYSTKTLATELKKIITPPTGHED